MKKVLFTSSVDSHMLHFHLPYLKYFKEKGYEVHVATNGSENIPYCDVKHIIPFEKNPFKLNNIKALIKLKKLLNDEKYNIVHTHTPTASVITRLTSINARKKFNTKVLYTAHGLHFFKGSSIINWMLFYPVEKFLSKYTDTLILINMEDYNLCKNKFKKCRNIKYVPGVGIDENKFNYTMTNEEKLNLKKSIGLKENDFVIIYPAELSKRKRQLWLINTLNPLLKKYNNIHLLLPGKDLINNKCQKLVGKLKLENQVHILGYREDIPKLLKISNLSVSSASQEGLPVNIMEAMYTSLPVVATNCRGNRDLIKDNVNGYIIDLDDKNKFVSSIEQIYNSKDLSNFKIENKKIINNYLLQNIMRDMNNIYLEIENEVK